MPDAAMFSLEGKNRPRNRRRPRHRPRHQPRLRQGRSGAGHRRPHRIRARRHRRGDREAGRPRRQPSPRHERPRQRPRLRALDPRRAGPRRHPGEQRRGADAQDRPGDHRGGLGSGHRRQPEGAVLLHPGMRPRNGRPGRRQGDQHHLDDRRRRASRTVCVRRRQGRGDSTEPRCGAIEWAEHNINVNTIAPFSTRTGLGRDFPDYEEMLAERARTIPMGRVLDPDDLVGAALFLASPASDFITGQTIVVDGGYSVQ